MREPPIVGSAQRDLDLHRHQMLRHGGLGASDNLAKTGTSRQTELLRLLQNATPPIRAPRQAGVLHL